MTSMDKGQETNIRIALASKALEHHMPQEIGFKDLQAVHDWVVAPVKATIIPATLVTQ